MTKDSFYKVNRKMILLLLFFSCISTYFAYNFSVAYGLGQTTVTCSSSLSDYYVSILLKKALAPLVGIGASPFITLTILSGAGSLLKTGMINAENIPLADTLMQLPISHSGVFVILLIITIAQTLLSLSSVTKVFCGVTLDRFESLIGTVCTVVYAFTVTSVTTVYAAEIAVATAGSAGIGSYILTNIISFVLVVLAYAIYYAMRTMVFATEILAFLFSPIPGSTGFFTIIRLMTISAFTWVAMSNPVVSTVVGIILVGIACLVFRKAKRLVLYYRRVYLIPYANSLFRRKYRVSLMPKKLPRGVATEFSDIDICVECFFMNKTSKLYKRERCYFIRSGDTNYIFKKRLFGKTVKMEISGDTYIEKPFIFRFLRIFTDEALHASQRRVNLVVRREHGKDIAELIEKTGLIDYNMILEERRRKKAEEMALKTQQMKTQAVEKLASYGKKARGIFGGIVPRKES